MSDLIAEIEFEAVNGEIDRHFAGRIITALRALPAVQPAHVNEPPKSEHVLGDMLTPATKGDDAWLTSKTASATSPS